MQRETYRIIGATLMTGFLLWGVGTLYAQVQLADPILVASTTDQILSKQTLNIANDNQAIIQRLDRIVGLLYDIRQNTR